jgi:hypothetical protein
MLQITLHADFLLGPGNINKVSIDHPYGLLLGPSSWFYLIIYWSANSRYTYGLLASCFYIIVQLDVCI